MKRVFLLMSLILVAVVALSACAAAPADEAGITVMDPWVRPAAMMGGNGAAFMTIINSTDADDRLVGAEADFANVVEVHESYMLEEGEMGDMEGMGDGEEGEGGHMGGMSDVMGMRPVDGVDVPAGGEAVLQPGGYHVMLIDFNQELEVGSTATVTLIFESGTTLEVEAPVQMMAGE